MTARERQQNATHDRPAPLSEAVRGLHRQCVGLSSPEWASSHPWHTGVEESWKRLSAGESAATAIEKFDASDLACRVACEVKRGDGSGGSFNADQFMEAKEQRRYDEFIHLRCRRRQAGHGRCRL